MGLKDHLCHRNSMPQAYIDNANRLMTTFLLGQSVGSVRLSVSIDLLQPGAKSCKFHSHSEQEEFFYILKGSCTIRFGDESTTLKTGDFISKPAGRGIAHQFINDSHAVVEILDIGVRSDTDKIYYPDEGVTFEPVRMTVQNQLGESLSDWNSAPTD